MIPLLLSPSRLTPTYLGKDWRKPKPPGKRKGAESLEKTETTREKKRERLEKTETTREKKSSLHLTHTLSKLICTKIEDLPIRSSPKLPLITLIKWLPNFYPTLILFYDFSSTPTLLLALESLYSLMKLVNKKESYWFGQKILSIENSFLFSVETACPSRRKGELIKCILVIWNNLWLFYHMK